MFTHSSPLLCLLLRRRRESFCARGAVGEAEGGAVGANEDELPHTICAVII